MLRLHTGEVRLSVNDEGGLIDLNSADPKLLGASLPRSAACQCAPTPSPAGWSTGGTRTAMSRSTEPNFPPTPTPAWITARRTCPFHSVDEARHILGLSPQDFERLKPYLTVFSGSPKIDPLFAPPPVLMAIPGSGKPAVQHILGARKAGGTATIFPHWSLR